MQGKGTGYRLDQVNESPLRSHGLSMDIGCNSGSTAQRVSKQVLNIIGCMRSSTTTSEVSSHGQASSGNLEKTGSFDSMGLLAMPGDVWEDTPHMNRVLEGEANKKIMLNIYRKLDEHSDT